MKHLVKHGKDTTYLHSIFGGLFIMHESIDDMIEFVEGHQGIVQYLRDSEGNSVPVLMEYIDVIFDGKKIWYNNRNEEFFNQLRVK